MKKMQTRGCSLSLKNGVGLDGGGVCSPQVVDPRGGKTTPDLNIPTTMFQCGFETPWYNSLLCSLDNKSQTWIHSSARPRSCVPCWGVVWKLLVDNLLLSGLLLNVSFLLLRELSLMYRSSDGGLALGAFATDPARSLESLTQAMMWRWEGATLLWMKTDFWQFHFLSESSNLLIKNYNWSTLFPSLSLYSI